ncbi:MAG: TIGR02186 family protein [Mesorhizobium sp.]|uniref:TIGR02186 family protein n=1 Tax=Mesorhizobium mediterraneum TaxID=43617 RepID=A0AB36R3F6_9HYPH|nr:MULTISPECIES: TIGR02186 family protein [Mesorhizobium]RUU42699.1 TIGR02186 family protein [Mesorhizobium sp. M6A.T.Ca.TU.002.02.2.1]AZO64564.1 TIGR02186 family protein [Mesorhizobium sp. M6A.T.Cr.TU.016.01.1.1]PAP99322.1 TIGR02186 family protein [Mesorhizobium mediterraneum]RUU30358.1 TIGR02186 family protein [Mesorhizobium sp. M6A.T.Ce.TU.016.01.1.1]RUU47284.1 TIGR02186 family protein [Mesorhizobium sp. M6A.T.Ce.TU.002.03.1.1]
MAGLRAFLAVASLSLFAAVSPGEAQTPAAENIQIGLSTDHVSITAGFSGADLTIFGSLENADPLVARQGRYDIIVVLEGPARPVVVRRKDRVLGIWINLESETFENVPVSYSVATTRPLQDVTDPNSYKQLSLGAANLYMQPADDDDSPATIEEFTAALRERKTATGLYSENVGGVQFLSQNLFRATVRLAPNVPVGTHKARAFLFKSGLFIKESSAQLEIRKSGFEQSIFRVAHDYSFLYGIFAVSLAMLTGWLGRLVFRKD